MIENPTLMALLPPLGTDDWVISSPGTYTGQWIESLEGATNVRIELSFAYGGGGTSVGAYVQSSLDSASNSYDIACIKFSTAPRIVVFSVTPQTTGVVGPSDAGLFESEGIIVPILGDRARLKVIVVGTYASGTVLSARILPS